MHRSTNRACSEAAQRGGGDIPRGILQVHITHTCTSCIHMCAPSLCVCGTRGQHACICICMHADHVPGRWLLSAGAGAGAEGPAHGGHA